MKIITIANWVFIGLYALLIIYSLTGMNRSGGDAASRGLESGYAFVVAFALAVLIVLNILPYHVAKITTLVFLLLPVFSTLYHFVNQYVNARGQADIAEARANGSLYFRDQPRQEIAAVIAAGDTARLQSLLQQPVSELNETGFQNTTLLDFAALTAVINEKPHLLMRCMELLLAHGATIQGPEAGHPPTHYLISQTGSAALLEWFLKKGADPNARPSKDANPILFEVMRYDKDRLEKVRLMLEYGADPNARSPNTGYAINPRTSVLLYAAQEQLWDVCQLLLERGANPNYRTPRGDDLKKIMTAHEELYADVDDTPAAYTAFKKFLETYSPPKP